MAVRLHDERMLLLMEFVVKDKKYKSINDNEEFLKSIGFDFIQNLYSIKHGKRSFSLDHFINAIEKYKINANYFFYKQAPLSFESKEKSAVDLLKAAIILLDTAK